MKGPRHRCPDKVCLSQTAHRGKTLLTPAEIMAQITTLVNLYNSSHGKFPSSSITQRPKEQPLTLTSMGPHTNPNQEAPEPHQIVREISLYPDATTYTHLGGFFAIVQSNVLKCSFHFFPCSSNSGEVVYRELIHLSNTKLPSACRNNS